MSIFRPKNTRRSDQRGERGATAIEYALMVGLIGVGIVAAVSSLRQTASDTLSYVAGDVYVWRIGSRTANLTILVEGTKVNGSWSDPVGNDTSRRDSTFKGTLIGNNLDAYRTSRMVGANNCTAHYTGTTTDNNKTFSGTWTGDYPGGCNPGAAPATFLFERIDG